MIDREYGTTVYVIYSLQHAEFYLKIATSHTLGPGILSVFSMLFIY